MACTPVYATLQDVADYVIGYVIPTDPADDLCRLDAAERDIDRLFVRPNDLVNGRRLDPTSLTADELAALKRAAAAQFEYRREMGDKFFVRAQWNSVSGPDFTTSGTLPRIGPKVFEELQGLFRWRQYGARATAGSRRGGLSGGFFTPGSLPWPGGLGSGYY